MKTLIGFAVRGGMLPTRLPVYQLETGEVEIDMETDRFANMNDLMDGLAVGWKFEPHPPASPDLELDKARAALRLIYSKLSDQYTITDRQMCDEIAVLARDWNKL